MRSFRLAIAIGTFGLMIPPLTITEVHAATGPDWSANIAGATLAGTAGVNVTLTLECAAGDSVGYPGGAMVVGQRVNGSTVQVTGAGGSTIACDGTVHTYVIPLAFSTTPLHTGAAAARFTASLFPPSGFEVVDTGWVGVKLANAPRGVTVKGADWSVLLGPSATLAGKVAVTLPVAVACGTGDTVGFQDQITLVQGSGAVVAIGGGTLPAVTCDGTVHAYSVPLSLPTTGSFHWGKAGARLTLTLNTTSGSETAESDWQTVSVG